MLSKEPALRASIVTPAGRAAVATVTLHGEQAADAALRHFDWPSRGQPPSLPIGRVLYGHWRDPRRSPRVAGEGVVICRRDETTVEVHCHGGAAAVEAIVQSLVDSGAKRTSWRDLASILDDDLIRAEAAVALAGVKTTRAAAILLDQHRGALRQSLEQASAEIERGDFAAAKERLSVLRKWARVGGHLTTPFRVAIVGRPNVGKSSLLNALLGFGRAIVFDQPGTTRDVVAAVTALDGWPVELADTAGLRAADEDVERQGVLRAQRHAQAADLVLLVADLHAGWTPEEDRLLACFPHALLVANKADLTSAAPPADAALVSALTGKGVEALIERVVDRLVEESPPPGAAVPFCERHFQMIERLMALTE